MDLGCLFVITILLHNVSFPFFNWHSVMVDHNLLMTFLYME